MLDAKRFGLVVVILVLACNALAGCGLLRSVIGKGPSPTATPIPSPTPTPIGGKRLRGLEAIPSDPGIAFTVEIPEQELNSRLANMRFEQEGLTIAEPHLVLAEGQIIGTFSVSYEESGWTFGLTARAQPYVKDGEIYVRVQDVSLDKGVTGLRRRIVEGLLDEIMRQLSAENGIRIPADSLKKVELFGVQVEPGFLVISGRTK